MNIVTDPKKIKHVMERGVSAIYPSREEFEKKLLTGERLTLYLGIDPTGPSLHIGHAIPLRKIKQFQELGHKVILLIGDFTAMIGDPTDKMAARKKLSKEEVKANLKNYKKQASKILDFAGKNPVEIRFNSKWFAKMNFADILELTSHFSVQRMMERDMFENRMKEGKPIYMHEFMYPVMQAYDSVAMDVDLEVGANDQTFNMLAGRDLMKALKNKEKFVLAVKLLADASGKKMGKTEGNMITLEDSPDGMFGKVMSWTDDMIIGGLELCTEIEDDRIAEIKKQLEGGANPRDAKAYLAKEMVRLYHGEDAAKEAEANFEKMFKDKEAPEDIEEVKIGKDKMNVVDLFLKTGMVASKGEARRLLEQKGLYIDGEPVVSANAEIRLVNGMVLKKGKRHFKRVVK